VKFVLDTIASDREWDAPISSGAHPPIAHLSLLRELSAVHLEPFNTGLSNEKQ